MKRFNNYSIKKILSGVINPKAFEVMKEVGYDLRTHRAKSLKEIPDIEYEIVITMGCLDECPSVKAKNHEDWNIPDPKGLSPEELRSVRDIIEDKVKELIYKIECDMRKL